MSERIKSKNTLTEISVRRNRGGRVFGGSEQNPLPTDAFNSFNER